MKLIKRKTVEKISLIIFMLLCIWGVNDSHVFASEITNPIYNSDAKTSTYSYVYFGHYPQSEIKGDDITEEIINANYNKVSEDIGIGIADNQQIWRFVVGGNKDNPVYSYYLVEPIKWKVLSVDNQFITLMSDSILDHGLYYKPGNNYGSSGIRSWLNGYDSSYNSEDMDSSSEFCNFVSSAFTQEEYDICQQQGVSSSNGIIKDYVILPYNNIVKNNLYGFYDGTSANSTRVKKATDYAALCASSSMYSKDINGWYTMDGVVNNSGSMSSYATVFGIVPMIKIRADSDLYTTEKPEIKLGTDISEMSCSLKYSSINYNGSEKKPEVTVKNGNYTLIENVDYTVEYENNVDAGIGNVYIRGAGYYYGTIKKQFIINKLNQNISNIQDSYSMVYGDASFRLNAVTSADGIINYSSSDENVIIVAPKTGRITIVGPGNATVTVTASETTNYRKSEKNISFIVKPSKVTELKSQAISSTSVTIKWNSVFGASGYAVYKYNELYEQYDLVDRITPDKTLYTFNNLLSNKSYKFKVRAFKDTKNGRIYGEKSDPLKIQTSKQILKEQSIKTSKIKTFKAKKLQKKKISFNLKAKTTGNGIIQYKIVKGKAKNISVSKNGKVVLKKGCKKGTYKIKITATGTETFKPASKVISIKVK